MADLPFSFFKLFILFNLAISEWNCLPCFITNGLKPILECIHKCMSYPKSRDLHRLSDSYIVTRLLCLCELLARRNSFGSQEQIAERPLNCKSKLTKIYQPRPFSAVSNAPDNFKVNLTWTIKWIWASGFLIAYSR